MIKCPDILTIQAVIDGEENDKKILEHLDQCAVCSEEYRVLKATVHLAGNLNSPAKLPASFYRQLAEKTAPRPFPAALVAAVLFAVALFSANLVNPGYLQWWFSVGITRQLSYTMDAFLDLLYMSHYVGPNGVIVGLFFMVVLEVFILNMLRNLEGKSNA
jgi:hypothetical protein